MDAPKRQRFKRKLSLSLCALFFLGGMFAKEIDSNALNEAKQYRELALLLFVVTFLAVQVMGAMDFVMQRVLRVAEKVGGGTCSPNAVPRGSPFGFCMVAGSAMIAFALGCWASISWRGPEFFWSGLVALGAGSGLFLGALLWLSVGRKTNHGSTGRPMFSFNF